MSNVERFAEWAEMLTAWCELEDGPDSISVTVGTVTLVTSAERAALFTPAGESELHIGERWALASPSSSKERQIVEGLTIESDPGEGGDV